MEEDTFKLDVVSVRLVKDTQLFSDKPLNSPVAAVLAMGDFMRELDREVVCVLNLNTKSKPINMNIASMGSISASICNPRELLKSSILSNAACIMLMHNHPSGDPEPSREDVQITDRMNRLCALAGIPLVDHIIVGSDDYYSFREKGLIKTPDLELAASVSELELGGECANGSNEELLDMHAEAAMALADTYIRYPQDLDMQTEKIRELDIIRKRLLNRMSVPARAETDMQIKTSPKEKAKSR